MEEEIKNRLIFLKGVILYPTDTLGNRMRHCKNLSTGYTGLSSDLKAKA
jgi:hypothetical protein